jgi:exodeoxyribonuclease VII small subunit
MTTQKTPNDALPPDIAKLSFEEALAELEKLVKQLEDGKAKLDDAMSAYERGLMLKRHCEAKLREAKSKVSLVAEGGSSLTPLDS